MYTKYKLYWTRAKLWFGSLGRDYMLMAAGQNFGVTTRFSAAE
jgi:hypothetical protein